MYLIYICTAIHVLVCLTHLYKSGKIIKLYRNKPPKRSPYRIGKSGLTKDEFGHRFIIDIDAEFCH